MLREGHIGLALTVIAPISAVVGAILPRYTMVLVLAGGLLGGNLPDIDTTTKIVKHRGFTHTIWFVIITPILGSIILFVTTSYIPVGQIVEFNTNIQLMTAIVFGMSIGIGVLTHLVGDVITPMGVRPYHPIFPRNIGNITISERKYVKEIRNASDPLLNKGFSLVGTVVTMGSIYLVFNTTI